MLEVRDVSKSFGRFRAVAGVSFRLEQGEIAGLLGPNGAGKTTTIRMITGFLPPDAGSIAVAGHDTVTDSIAARRQLGYLPESAPLYPEMTPASYLAYRAALYGIPRVDRPAAIRASLARCWLEDVAEKRIGHLSKGYRQRVGLSAALLHNPRILILDEPTNALDPTQVRETRRLIAELARDRVVLLSSHILAEVELVCTRVIIMVRGRVRADGTPRALMSGKAALCRAQWRSESEAADDRVLDALRAIPGGDLRDCTREGARVSVTVEPTTVGDVQDAVAKVLHDHRVMVLSLSRDSTTLEKLFVDLVSQSPQGEGVPA